MTKTFKDVKGIEEACWVGYKQVGMKKKGNRQVPNCVKEEIVYAVFGKDYVYKEPVTEAGVEDMYKGKLNKDQLNTIKNTWKNKKLSDVTQGVKDMIRGYDAFTRMDIKQANIKYLSDLINDEVQHEEIEMIDTLTNMVEDNELRSLVRGNKELKEGYFSKDQLDRLAKAYSVMKGRTISPANAQKLGKMIDRIPDNALNDLRKKKIPFISGLALSKMIQKKIPVTESAWEISGVENEGREEIKEADLSKSQIKKVHKQADDLPKKDFIKRYGKDGDSVRYATATNMVKKKLGLGESNFIKKGELKMNDTYKQRLTSAMEHFNIGSLGELNEDDHKTFFSYVDDMKEGLSAAQKKLPPALQKAIAAKMKDKKEAMHKDKKEAMHKDKKEDLVGGQKKLDKDKDGDLDAKDFAMLRKSGTKKEGGPGSGPQPGDGAKYKTGHKKTVMKPGAGARPGSAKDGGQTDKEADDYDSEINSSYKMKKEYGSMNAMKMKKEEKTKETDSEPKMKDLNAMQMNAMKAKPMNAMKDMNAGYMKSNVKAAVMNNGGADMAKVKDKSMPQEPMKKITAMKTPMVNAMKKMNAMYGEEKKYLKTKPGSLEEAVLVSRGLVKK